LVGRGVLDVARHKGVDSLEEGYGITCADLDGTAKNRARHEAWRLRDRAHRPDGALHRGQELGRLSGGDAPARLETLEWIKRVELAALASDTWGCEVRPNEPSPASTSPGTGSPIPIMGMTMGEIFNLKGPRRRLRGRQDLRVHVRRAGDPDHRRGRLAGQSAGD